MFLVARDLNGCEWTFAHPFTGRSELPSSLRLRPNPDAHSGKLRLMTYMRIY